MNNLKELKEEAYIANMKIQKNKLAICTFGNVSAYNPEKAVFAIKPSGVPYEDLKPENMIVVDLENRVVEGKLRPSSDTKTHTVLYKNIKNIKGIVHTHSTYATAWSQALMPIPIYGTTHADALPREIPITEIMSDEMIKGNYEEETGNQILQSLKNYTENEDEMILVACHGPFTWGESADKAVYNSIVLEELAKMALFTCQINPQIKTLKESLINKHYERKHGNNSYYGQT